MTAPLLPTVRGVVSRCFHTASGALACAVQLEDGREVFALAERRWMPFAWVTLAWDGGGWTVTGGVQSEDAA